MAAVVFAYNHARDPMNPAQLGNQIATALTLATDPRVDIDPANITVTGAGVTENGRAAIQAVIDAYVFDPVWAGGIEAVLRAKAAAGLAANATYLAQPALPAGTLTLAQLTAAARILRDQTDLLTRENNALIRLAVGLLDSTGGT